MTCALVLTLNLVFTQNQPAKSPPNILLIISDDQAFTDYGFMGHPNIKTPNLDRLAQKGKFFNNGYVTSSLCSPSLSALLTGRYPHETKLTANEPPLPAGVDKAKRYQNPKFLAQVGRMQQFAADQPKLPALLKDAGYLTLQTGKWWMGDPKNSGFTHSMTHGDPARGGRHGDAGLEIGRKTLAPITTFLDEAKASSKPFFVWYAPMLPHQPHNPPDRLLAKYKGKTTSLHVAKYWAMCEWFDETIGDLLAQLERRGLANDTLIAYVTDNGGWIPVSEIYARGAAGDYAILRYWSLVESADARGAVKNASGFWRLTDRGKRFAEGQLRLPKYALVFDNNVLGHEGALVTIHECLGKRFSYVSLMAR